MHRNDHPTAISGLHHKGDPQTNRPATVVTHEIMNALQEEVAHVVEAYLPGLDKADNYQLLKAIREAITTTLTDDDYVTRPELGDAAFKNTGTGTGQVAAGNHGHSDLATKQELNSHLQAPDPHSQYALESQLGNAAYKNVGTGPNDVAAGNHTHGATGNTVAVLTGVLSNDQIIPLPSGFTEAQCHWIVSPHTVVDEGSNDLNSFQVYTVGRVVKILTEFSEPMTQNRANYMIVGVK